MESKQDQSMKVIVGILITLIIAIMGFYQFQISQLTEDIKELRLLVEHHGRQGAHPFQEAKTQEIINRMDKLEEKIDRLIIQQGGNNG